MGVSQNYIHQFEGLRKQFEKKLIPRSLLMIHMDLAYNLMTSSIDSETAKNRFFRILQGSAWIQTQNLLAKSIYKRKEYQFAKPLLHKPAVIRHIISTLKSYKKAYQSYPETQAFIERISSEGYSLEAEIGQLVSARNDLIIE